MVAHSDAASEAEACDWISKTLQPADSLERAASVCLAAWQTLTEKRSFASLTAPGEARPKITGKVVEAALLDRQLAGPVYYRKLAL